MRSYAMTDSETIEENTTVTHAKSSLVFLDVEIARAEDGFVVRPVLLTRMRIPRCTE